MAKRKYLVEEEKAIKDAKQAYRDALIKLQESCKHNTVLEHIDSNYHMFRVCEECGSTCRADWSSPVWAYGNLNLLEGRAYSVGWTEFAKTAPAVDGWCQTRDDPMKFRRGTRRSA